MIKFFALLLFSSAYCFAETPPAKLPNEAAILKKNYEAEVQRTIKPLSERYLVNLKRLLDQATRAGKLAEALSIKAEMDSFTAARAVSTETFESKLLESAWKWKCSSKFTFLENGEANGIDIKWRTLKPYTIEFSRS